MSPLQVVTWLTPAVLIGAVLTVVAFGPRLRRAGRSWLHVAHFALAGGLLLTAAAIVGMAIGLSGDGGLLWFAVGLAAGAVVWRLVVIYRRFVARLGEYTEPCPHPSCGQALRPEDLVEHYAAHHRTSTPQLDRLRQRHATEEQA